MCAASEQLGRSEVSTSLDPAPAPLDPAPARPVGAGVGRRAEFERFFAEMGPQLMRAAYLMTGSRADAEDLVQEVLSRAWLHWPRLSHHDRPEAWARRVLSNLVINRWKHRAVERRHEAAPLNRAGSEPAEVEHLDLLAALAALPARARTAIILHDVAGVSVKEIAREMRVPQGTVRSWMHRGRRALAARLGEGDCDAGR